MSDVVRGVNSSMALVQPGATPTASLVVPAVGVTDTAVLGAAFTLPEAKGYIFDLSNAGTIDDAGHTAKLDMAIQVLLPNAATWEDVLFLQAANRTAQRMLGGFAGVLAGPSSLVTSSLVGTNLANGAIQKNIAQSVNGASVVSPVTSGGMANILVFARTFRLVGVPRTAAPTVGDTITLAVTALVDPNESV